MRAQIRTLTNGTKISLLPNFSMDSASETVVVPTETSQVGSSNNLLRNCSDLSQITKEWNFSLVILEWWISLRDEEWPGSQYYRHNIPFDGTN